MQNQLKLGIISEADVAIESNMIREKELKLKKRLVNEVHRTSKGELRSIAHHAPTASYSEGYVYTKLEGKVILKAKTEEELYEKLYDHYYGCEMFTVSSVFELAIAEKKNTENPKDTTIRKYGFDFDRYINPDLQNKDIRQITEIDLMQYSQNLVNSSLLTKKQFLVYKGILNLVFRYAHRHGIINYNPVLQIKNTIYLKSCDCSVPEPEEKILTQEEIRSLIMETAKRAQKKYYLYHYSLQFSSLTGMRVGELCALKWSDIDFGKMEIHIHRQQLSIMQNGHYVYYEVPYTKNERGIANGGRVFPVTDKILAVLTELSGVQKKENIRSEYIFCHNDGKWMNTKEYDNFLRKLCKKLGFKVTNNHGLRMSLNSNVFIPNGVSVADRAKLLGHSVSTNLNYYSYAQKDYIENTRNILNNMDEMLKEPHGNPYSTFPFRQAKSPQTANL